MASIRQLPSGRWAAEICVQATRESKTFGTRREANAWSHQREHELRTPAALRYTVRDMLERYAREESPKKEGADKEKLRIAALLRDFPLFGDRRLADVSATDIATWRDARLKVVKPGSVARDVRWLRNAFRLARLEWKWMDSYPFDGLRVPADSPARRRVVGWREARMIARNCGYRTGREPRTKVEEVALAMLIAMRTGMRAGEVLSLGRHNVDLERRVARVEHKMQYQTGEPRDVPLSRQAARLLRVHLQARERIFTLDSASLDALWRKVTGRLMVEDLHFHDTRGTALTHLARRVDVMRLAKISGHKNIKTLFERYYRERAEDIARAL